MVQLVRDEQSLQLTGQETHVPLFAVNPEGQLVMQYPRYNKCELLLHCVHVVALVQLKQFDEQFIQVFVAELRKVDAEQLELQLTTPETIVCTKPP